MPFTRLQLDRLGELKAELEKRDALSALDPEMPKINLRVDELSVIIARFGIKNLPKESRRPGEILFVFNSTGEYAEIKPGFGVFHPDLPSWAKEHLIKWIREHRAGFWRPDGRDVLRETGIVGIETGMKAPIDWDDIVERKIVAAHWELIKHRVIELRDVDDKKGKLTKRTRKNNATWNWVIDKLVEEKLLPKKITRQAFKKQWKKYVPGICWKTI
jgi:hypothetical protein